MGEWRSLVLLQRSFGTTKSFLRKGGLVFRVLDVSSFYWGMWLRLKHTTKIIFFA